MASLPYPRSPLKASHRIHRIHRSFWRRIFSHGIHGMLGCVIGGVGMAGCHTLLICAHLCLSVGGFLCQKVLCVLCILWELSLFALLVLQRQLHQRGSILPRISRISTEVRLRYWRRGYGRMPYPPNLCASVSICGRHFSARMFCVFRVFCGTLSLFALLVLQRQLHQRDSILPQISRMHTDG